MDHDTYLVPRGTADRFFPTDFSLLGRLYEDAARRARAPEHGSTVVGGGEGAQGAADRRQQRQQQERQRRQQQGRAWRALKSGAFLGEWAPDLGATATRSGYNPLLEDYSNTAFFLAGNVFRRPHA